MNKDNNSSFFKWFKSRFKKPREITKGDIGIYHDIISIRTITDERQPIHYDIFCKIKVLESFDDLVEIELINVTITDSCNEEIINLVTSMIPKYLRPKYINWMLNDKSTI